MTYWMLLRYSYEMPRKWKLAIAAAITLSVATSIQVYAADENALDDCMNAIIHPVPPKFLSSFSTEMELGEASEKLGEFEEALRHYEKGGEFFGNKQQVALLIKMHRYSEALPLCTQALDRIKKNDKKRRYSPDLPVWLMLSSSAKSGLGLKDESLADLKTAAIFYAQDDSNSLKKCLGESNITIQPSDLPGRNRELVFKLLETLSTSTKPLDVASFNQIVGTNLRMPSGAFYVCDQDRQISAPQWFHASYRINQQLEPDSALANVELCRMNCAIDKKSIMEFLPSKNLVKTPIRSMFQPSILHNAEQWIFPAGTLVLGFADSGFEVLENIEWRGKNCVRYYELDSIRNLANEMDIAILMNDTKSAFELANKAVKHSRKQFNSKEGGGEEYSLFSIYLKRARLYLKEGKVGLAMADLQSRQDMNGFVEFSKTIDLLQEFGMIPEAIKETERVVEYVQDNSERNTFKLLLAKLNLQNKSYDQASKLASETINNLISQNPELLAPAYLIKARGESASGKLELAIMDGAKAADLFHEIGRIECSEKIRNWTQSMQSKSSIK